MKLLTSIFAFLLALTLLGSQPPNTMRRCRTYVDPVLHVQFPSTIDDLHMATRTTYRDGDYDYGIRYNSEESKELVSGGRHLDVFVYTRDDEPMSDGMNEKVDAQLKETHEDIKRLGGARALR